MHPTSVNLSTAITVLAAFGTLLTGHGVSAGPAVRRADASSVSATVTSSAAAVASSASSVTSPASSQSSLAPPPRLSGSFPECHQATGPMAPFCLPDDGSTANPGQSYYVTWDADHFPLNSTVTIELNYANASKGGVSAWSSSLVRNSYGYTIVNMNKAWLQGDDWNNLTFFLVEMNPAANAKPNIITGPTIMLEKPAPVHYPPSPKTNAPNHLGLVVGLPVTLGCCALIVLGLFIGMRRTRHIGLGNVMSRNRKKGYGIGKSYRQRMRGGKNGGIQLREHEVEPVLAADPLGDEFDDHNMPARRPRHAQHDSLGSLVASPTVPDYSDNGAPRGHNAFRDELDRQQNRL